MSLNLRLSALCGLVAAAVGCSSSESGGAKYGEELTLSETTRISQVLNDPESYVGQRLLVEGTVVNVCEMRGCWLELASDRDFEKLRIKVDDGVMVFPMSARGQKARVEGVFEKLTLTEEEALEQARHQAEEHGTEFDPSVVSGPATIYQLKGIGALIEDQG
ncbi:MAG: hypothetical protein AMS18_12835 [Gemmatimonas sp. SG8_17]|nr:MAG: hypothetical protein AMS18_12835 [Gemmatimonas sp. SG8_17]